MFSNPEDCLPAYLIDVSSLMVCVLFIVFVLYTYASFSIHASIVHFFGANLLLSDYFLLQGFQRLYHQMLVPLPCVKFVKMLLL